MLAVFFYKKSCVILTNINHSDIIAIIGNELEKGDVIMSYKRVLTIQDISCLGQCSMTVALPIISACSHETCILPSAVLSTHTGGFSGYTVNDLSGDFPAIKNHWVKEGISFDAIYLQSRLST